MKLFCDIHDAEMNSTCEAAVDCPSCQRINRGHFMGPVLGPITILLVLVSMFAAGVFVGSGR